MQIPWCPNPAAQMAYHLDVFGIRRDTGNRAALESTPNYENVTFNALDALSWHEYRQPFLPYRIPGYITPVMTLPKDHTGKLPEETVFVTSPNATFIPDLIGRDQTAVIIREDGRFGPADFSVFPQWYFPSTYYLPFVRRKPEQDALASHPYRLMWYNMTPNDFVPEAGSLISGYGRFNREITVELTRLRIELRRKVDMLIHNRQMSDIQARELRHCSRALQYSSITLETAPQDYLFTLLNLTSFQRLFLETLACYEYFTIWEERKTSMTRLPVDMSIMGAFTCNVEQAEEFNQIGVPVWIVRHCSQLTRTMKVGIPVFARDPEGCVLAPHPGTGSVYKGHPSALRNRMCQGLRLQQVKLGHAAYEQQPGEALHASGSLAFSAGHQPPLPPGPQPLSISQSQQLRQPTQVSVPTLLTPETWHRIKLADAKSITPNMVKFSPPPSERTPQLSPIWLAALKGVDRDTSKIWDHPNRVLFKGFALPDPFMLTSPDIKQGRLERHLIVWLLLRPGWITHTTSRSSIHQSVMPQTQNWKTFFVHVSRKLGLEQSLSSIASSSSARGSSGLRGRPIQGDHRPSGKIQKVQKTRSPANVDDFQSMFDLNITAEPVDVYWDGDLIKTRAMLEEGKLTLALHTVRQVIWDLYELNFRIELLALDRSIFPHSKMSSEQVSVRESLVLDIFPDGMVVFHRLPVKDEGLGAKDWLTRIQYVEAFRKFVVDWPSSPSGTLVSISDSLASTPNGEEILLAMERMLFSFYCQTFFLYFGRAPSVPHHLP